MKKVFKNEAEVIELIDKYKAQILETLGEIEQTNHLADALRNTKEAHRISGLRQDVETMHREIEWRTGRLETLKEILAEMRTLQLPFNKLNELDGPGEAPAPEIEVAE